MRRDGAGRGAHDYHRINYTSRFILSSNHPVPIGGKEPGIKPLQTGNKHVSANLPNCVQTNIISARSENYPKE